LGGLAGFCGAIVNVLVGVNLDVATTTPISSDAAERFLVTSVNSEFSHIFAYYVYFVSEYAAPVVMGFALWRSRGVAGRRGVRRRHLRGRSGGQVAMSG
jgi:hypothetical protein